MNARIKWSEDTGIEQVSHIPKKKHKISTCVSQKVKTASHSMGKVPE